MEEIRQYFERTVKLSDADWNSFSSIEHINLYEANYNGAGLEYLWFRIPLQLFFIVWIYLSAIKKFGTPGVNRLSPAV